MNGYNDRRGCIRAHACVLGEGGLSTTTFTKAQALTCKTKTGSIRESTVGIGEESPFFRIYLAEHAGLWHRPWSLIPCQC